MPRGICKLCQRLRNLQESHLIPRALYAMSRDPTDKNPHPVIITAAVAMRTSRQVKDYILCKKCEQLFNDNGERWMMS